ncbi:MAG: class I SAM-dependent methyltransferase [Thermoguttaceae bacterium]
MALAPSLEFPASTARADLLQDNQYLAGLLAETTGRPLDEVQGRLRCEHRLLGSNVGDALRRANLEPHVWNDGLIAFYGATDAFLYETVVWNQMAEKEAMRQWIIEFLRRKQLGPQRILAYGDGPGIDSLRLAQAGHQVTYFEVGDRNLRFARRLFADAQAAVEIVSAEAPWQTAAYDAVVCLDVLEHVPQPVETVAQLSRLLRPGGRLFVHAPFWLLDGRCVTHLRSNLTFSGDWRRLYASNGLVPLDARLFWNPIVLEKPAAGTGRKSPDWAAGFRLRCGGWLLRLARFTPAIHIWACRRFFVSSTAGGE